MCLLFVWEFTDCKRSLGTGVSDKECRSWFRCECVILLLFLCERFYWSGVGFLHLESFRTLWWKCFNEHWAPDLVDKSNTDDITGHCEHKRDERSIDFCWKEENHHMFMKLIELLMLLFQGGFMLVGVFLDFEGPWNCDGVAFLSLEDACRYN